jgi:hypothetical protein
MKLAIVAFLALVFKIGILNVLGACFVLAFVLTNGVVLFHAVRSLFTKVELPLIEEAEREAA